MNYNVPMGGYESSYVAWCSPTSAANQLGYLVDNNWLTQPTILNDGVIAGHTIPNADQSSTIGWDIAHGWGDYLLDGPSKRPAPKGSMPINLVTDFGWYMDTNNLGMNGGAANSQVGTTITNIYNGMVKFYGDAGWKNIIGMAYNKYTPQFLGTANEYPEFWKSQGYNNTISLDKDCLLYTSDAADE